MEPQDGQRVTAASAPILGRRISLTLIDDPLGLAAQRIAEQAELDVTCSTEFLPPGARASIEADDVTVASALTRVLASARVDVAVSSAGSLTLVPQTNPPTAQDSVGMLTEAS